MSVEERETRFSRQSEEDAAGGECERRSVFRYGNMETLSCILEMLGLGLRFDISQRERYVFSCAIYVFYHRGPGEVSGRDPGIPGCDSDHYPP